MVSSMFMFLRHLFCTCLWSLTLTVLHLIIPMDLNLILILTPTLTMFLHLILPLLLHLRSLLMSRLDHHRTVVADPVAAAVLVAVGIGVANQAVGAVASAPV